MRCDPLRCTALLIYLICLGALFGCGASGKNDGAVADLTEPSLDAALPVQNSALRLDRILTIEQGKSVTLTSRPANEPRRHGKVVADLGQFEEAGLFADDQGWAISGYSQARCGTDCSTLTYAIFSAPWDGDVARAILRVDDGPPDDADGPAVIGRSTAGLVVGLPGELVVTNSTAVVTRTRATDLGAPCVLVGETYLWRVVDGRLEITSAGLGPAETDHASFTFDPPPGATENRCLDDAIVWLTDNGRAKARATLERVWQVDDSTEAVAHSVSARQQLSRLLQSGKVQVYRAGQWRDTAVTLSRANYPSSSFAAWADGDTIAACVVGQDPPPTIRGRNAADFASCSVGKVLG